jgi:MraZ protein
MWETVGYCGRRMRNPGGRAPPTRPPGFDFADSRWKPLNFHGTFEHALDAKHRLTVPAKYRAALANGVVLAASVETTPDAPRSIAIWTPQAYEAYTSAALQGLNPLSPRARDLKRFLFGFSHDTELDAAHRVMIPGTHIEFAGLDKDVIVLGSGECLEVFDRTRYEAWAAGQLNRIPDLAQSLGDTT